MGEDFLDHRLLQDHRDHLHRVAVFRAKCDGAASQSRWPQAAESLRKISTRRFCERLLSLSLPATGSRERAQVLAGAPEGVVRVDNRSVVPPPVKSVPHA